MQVDTGGTMRQHMRYTRLLAVLLGLSLVAAACGDDEDEPEAGGEDGQQEEGQQEDPAVAALLETGEADPSCEAEEDGVLRIGGLLPETGDLAFMGPPMNTGAGLAIADINEAGGVNGADVEFGNEDSGDGEPSIAPDAVDRHMQQGADVILGAAASGISLNVIDTVTANCRIQFSPANTAVDFTTYDDDDLYFRTAPADIMQGQLQAELALEDGGGDAAILARQDSYGQGLADYITLFYEQGGGGEIIERRNYDPEAAEFSAEVEAVINADPDILFMVGFEESYSIMQDLFEQNFTPDEKKIYFVDGNISNTAGETITEPGALVGIRGTLPSPPEERGGEFRDRMHQENADLQDEIYGPETYDAVTVVALAAQAAGTDRADEVARHINGVTNEGTECTSYAECLQLLEDGEDIDYSGVSGPVDFGRPGEPQRGTYAIQAYGEDNRIDPEQTEFREVELPS
jgi:ABC-type branched-subunit amino acid transport system substrate-binding protein